MQLLSLVIYCLLMVMAGAREFISKKSNTKIIEAIAVTGVVGMFLISGLDKLLPPQITGLVWGGSDVARLDNIYNTQKSVITAIVLAAGVLELIGSGSVLYGHYFNDKSLKRKGLTLLSVFTVAATLVVYANPLVGIKKIPIISNMNTLGGILALWT